MFPYKFKEIQEDLGLGFLWESGDLMDLDNLVGEYRRIKVKGLKKIFQLLGKIQKSSTRLTLI